MTAYIIVEAVLHDPERFGAYAKVVPDIVAEFGGEYLVLGGKQAPLEGDWGRQDWSCTAGHPQSRPGLFGTATRMRPQSPCGPVPANFASCWWTGYNRHRWSNPP